MGRDRDRRRRDEARLRRALQAGRQGAGGRLDLPRQRQPEGRRSTMERQAGTSGRVAAAVRDRLKRAPRRLLMAIKYGRPIESRVRVVPAEARDRTDGRAVARSHHPPAPQPPHRMGAPHGARECAHHRRPDLAAVRRSKAARAPVASMPGVERLTVDDVGARGRARRQAHHPVHRAVSLHRSGSARRERQRGAQPRQSRLPRDPRHQEGGAARSASCATSRSTPTPATATTA